MKRRLAFFALTLSVGSSCADGLPGGSPIKPAPNWRAEPLPAKPASATTQPKGRPDDVLPGQNDYYDPLNPAYGQLQKANQALAGMPLDRAGFVDWMRLINDGRIAPRSSLAGSGGHEVLDLDVLLKNTRQMPWVRFPHRSHTLWLDCSNCHPEPFAQEAGTAQMSMEAIFRGRWCGMCHDRVAFITHLACDRCHSVPNPAATR